MQSKSFLRVFGLSPQSRKQEFKTQMSNIKKLLLNYNVKNQKHYEEGSFLCYCPVLK